MHEKKPYDILRFAVSFFFLSRYNTGEKQKMCILAHNKSAMRRHRCFQAVPRDVKSGGSDE